MNLQEMLDTARQKEADMQREYDVRTAEYQAKKLKNDEIRRNLSKEEDALKEQIPKESFEPGSDWSKLVEDIRVLERLLEAE